jgi:hypothetical protein
MNSIDSPIVALLEHAQLFTAATEGKASDVDRLIQGGANKDAKDAKVRTCASHGGRGCFRNM